jgi:hypothetical protein
MTTIADERMTDPPLAGRLHRIHGRLVLLRHLVGIERDPIKCRRLRAEADELQRLLVPPIPDRLARFAG